MEIKYEYLKLEIGEYVITANEPQGKQYEVRLNGKVLHDVMAIVRVRTCYGGVHSEYKTKGE